jgi:hypothetical protein
MRALEGEEGTISQDQHLLLLPPVGIQSPSMNSSNDKSTVTEQALSKLFSQKLTFLSLSQDSVLPPILVINNIAASRRQESTR